MYRTTEWLNANRHRNYPLVEDARMELDNGVEIPTGSLLDMHVAVYDKSFRAVYLTNVAVTSGGVPSVFLTFKYEGFTTTAFQLEVPATAAFPYTTTLSDLEFYHVRVTLGEDILQLLDTMIQPSSRAVYSPIRVEPAVVKFHNKHRVNQVRGEGVTGYQEVLDGHILCKEGRNCVISIDPATNRIRVVAVKGAGEGRVCDEDTDEDNLTCADTVLYVNGMHGNNLGEFRILGGPGVEIEALPDDNEIRIRSTLEQDELRECGS